MRFVLAGLVVLAGLLIACRADGPKQSVVASLTPSDAAAPSRTGPPSPAPSRTAWPAPPPAPEITVRPGFRATVFASGFNRPTAMAWGPDGRLYVTQDGEVVWAVAGGARPTQVVTNLETPLGLVWIGQQLFISEQGRVTLIDFSVRPAAAKVIIEGLPFKRHQQDNIAAGPDGRLYLGSGSTCDACDEPDRRSAAILSFKPDGSDLKVVASGLRNPFGLAFQPATGKLYATVNGQDDLDGPAGPEPADMLVRIEDNAFYGWPRCWPSAQEVKLKGACVGVTPPAAYLAPHGSADGLAFYTGVSFPADYAGNVFIAQWGTYAADTPSGRNVVRVELRADGTAGIDRVSVFATGFAHPIAVVVDPDGALLVADYERGVIYRIQATQAP